MFTYPCHCVEPSTSSFSLSLSFSSICQNGFTMNGRTFCDDWAWTVEEEKKNSTHICFLHWEWLKIVWHYVFFCVYKIFNNVFSNAFSLRQRARVTVSFNAMCRYFCFQANRHQKRLEIYRKKIRKCQKVCCYMSQLRQTFVKMMHIWFDGSYKAKCDSNIGGWGGFLWKCLPTVYISCINIECYAHAYMRARSANAHTTHIVRLVDVERSEHNIARTQMHYIVRGGDDDERWKLVVVLHCAPYGQTLFCGAV